MLHCVITFLLQHNVTLYPCYIKPEAVRKAAILYFLTLECYKIFKVECSYVL